MMSKRLHSFTDTLEEKNSGNDNRTDIEEYNCRKLITFLRAALSTTNQVMISDYLFAKVVVELIINEKHFF